MGVLKDKSYSFAVRIAKFYRILTDEKREYVMSKQMLRSGTSIGAQVREAVYAQSRPDFITKLHIALKEANETLYWLELLRAADYTSEREFKSLSTDCQELLRILTSSLKTAKEIK